MNFPTTSYEIDPKVKFVTAVIIYAVIRVSRLLSARGRLLFSAWTFNCLVK